MLRLFARFAPAILALAVLVSFVPIVPVSAAAKQEIEFMFCANQDEATVWKELVDIFNKSQNRITVKANWDPGGWGGSQSKALVRMAAGDAPAVFRLSDEAFLEWAKKGYLVSLQPFIKRDGFKLDQFIPTILKPLTYKGELYGFPQGIATRALAYNIELFDKAGLLYPQESWRWDKELLEAAKKLTYGKEGSSCYGIGLWCGGAGTLVKDIPEIIWDFGGEVFTEDHEFRLDQPGSIAALEFLASLVAVYKVYPQDWDIVGRFLNGRLGMWNTGVWDVNLLRNQAKYEWDFAPTPGGPAGAYSFIQTNGAYVILNRKQADAAWEFIKFLMSEEAQTIFCLKYSIGGVPVRKDLISAYLKQPPPPKHRDAFAISVQRGRMVTVPPAWDEIVKVLDKDWGAMIRGQMAAAAWAKSVKPAVEEILKKAK